MLIIYPQKKLPKDYAFMEESEKVLKDKPVTWKVYPDSIEGAKKIIDMEYKELQESKDKSHELVHLASACLLLWRKLNNAE